MDYFRQEIEMIRQTPILYIGRKSVSALYHHIMGFGSAMHRFGITDKIEKLLPLPIMQGYFHDYVANYYNYSESTAGWCNIILQENDFDEEKGYEMFLKLFDIFSSLSIQHCLYAKLNGDAISYHNTNKYAPKKTLAPDYVQIEPLYRNPVEVYLFELSHNAGYIHMINTDTQHCLHTGMHKHENNAAAYLKNSFGPDFRWCDMDVENYKFYLELLVF